MGSSITARAVLVALVITARPGFAQEPENVVLLLCNEDVLGSGGQACPSFHAALGSELSDFGVGVELVLWSGAPIPQGELVPAEVAALHVERGGIASAWLSGSADGLLTAHVYDTGNEQTVSRVLGVLDAEGLGLPEVAFHLRLILGASLYSDLDRIVEDEDLVALAVPEERKVVIEKLMPPVVEPVPEVPGPHSRIRLTPGYLLVGYPTEKHWFHGFAMGLSVVPVARLEIGIEVAAAFTPEHVRRDDPLLDLHNTQIFLALGAGYEVLRTRRIGILPQVGFRLGFSRTELLDGQERKTYVKLNPALWAGVDLRVYLGPHLGLFLGTRFEYVMHHELYDVPTGEVGDDGRPVYEKLYSLAQFRFGVTAGFCVLF